MTSSAYFFDASIPVIGGLEVRRRTRIEPSTSVLRAGPIVVDPIRHEVTVRGEPVGCTPAEFRLPQVLASEVDRVFTREQLLERLHGFDRYITDRTIDTHVKNLRRKIEQNSRCGSVDVASTLGKGTTFTLRLPG